jgi:hypothetical protein
MNEWHWVAVDYNYESEDGQVKPKGLVSEYQHTYRGVDAQYSILNNSENREVVWGVIFQVTQTQ